MLRLADKGIYLASESTFYRILRRSGEVHRRGASDTAAEGGSPNDLYGGPTRYGHHLAALSGAGPLVLSVHDNRPVQLENHGL